MGSPYRDERLRGIVFVRFSCAASWTGYQNEGKSLFLNQLALIKAFTSGWKFAVFSPKISLDDFFNDLIETYIVNLAILTILIIT
jgi:hypothetical protein